MSRLARRVSLVSVMFVLTGCGGDGSHMTDSTPQKLDGSESHEFEQDDTDRAARASDAVKEYCAGAVSEAQRLGCESHARQGARPSAATGLGISKSRRATSLCPPAQASCAGQNPWSSDADIKAAWDWRGCILRLAADSVAECASMRRAADRNSRHQVVGRVGRSPRGHR